MSIVSPFFPSDIAGVGGGVGAPDLGLSFLDQDPLNLFPVELPFTVAPEQIDQYNDAEDYVSIPAAPPASLPPSSAEPQPQPQPTTKSNQGKRRTNLSRHERSLERNRIAASKCRQKKRAYTNSLESRCNSLAETRMQLENERNELRVQLLGLKNELLQHAHCNDGRVGEQLARMMQQITQGGQQSSPSASSVGGGSEVQHRGSIGSTSDVPMS